MDFNNNIASVVIANSTREFDREFHYFIPEELPGTVQAGSRVIVPFGKSNSKVEGYVTGITDKSDKDDLKQIIKLVEEKPAFNFNGLLLARWMKENCLCSLSDAIRCMIPPGSSLKSSRCLLLYENQGNTDELLNESFKGISRQNVNRITASLREKGGTEDYNNLKDRVSIKGFGKMVSKLESLRIVRLEERFYSDVKEKKQKAAYLAAETQEIIDEIESGRIKSIQQIKSLELLMENEYIFVSDFMRFANISQAVLNTLKKRGLIDFKDVEIIRDPVVNSDIKSTEAMAPGREQEAAINGISGMILEGAFGEALIRGVTGSGKTEVYLQVIDRAMNLGKKSIVLVPEISLTPQTVERFKGRFGEDVAVLHSRLSLGERYDQWRLIRDGRIKVVVGARSAVFAPIDNLGLIIIDEEHENSYKSEMNPRYHARDVARERCRLQNAVLVLGSATPSVETYYRARKGEIRLFEMLERANNAGLPEVEIVDMRRELDSGNRSIFSTRLYNEIEENIKQEQQTILFMNRRGHSTFVICRKCGYTMKCLNCNISLTYHANDSRLICHYCGYTVKNPELCPRCLSNYIKHFGTGTQKIEEEVKKAFQTASVIRMDIDTTGYKNSHGEILDRFKNENINIMVGTQMIAKGHDFPLVTLVGVLAADSLTGMDDFRASERAFQLISQVAGRAGRAQLPGRVIIQAYNTEDYTIVAAGRHDYTGFYEKEIALREKLWYPPYCDVVSILLTGFYEKNVILLSKEIWKYLWERIKSDSSGRVEPAGSGRAEPVSSWRSELLGPSRCRNYRLRNKYRWRIIIKIEDFSKIRALLENIYTKYNKEAKKNGVNINIDINPASML